MDLGKVGKSKMKITNWLVCMMVIILYQVIFNSLLLWRSIKLLSFLNMIYPI